MGGLCSKNSNAKNSASNNKSIGQVDYYSNKVSNLGYESNMQSNLRSTSQQEKQVQAEETKQSQQQQQQQQQQQLFSYANATADDDFYDGIPRYQSLKSRSARARVSEVSSRLGGKAVEVLDTLGSSMTNLNPNSGFASGVATKGNELEILAFEVANTIVKGSSLMQSLSKRSIRQLQEVVLPSEGVQNLISKDMDELMRIVAADEREEFKIFSGEVVRFGNRCKDPQWHNLDRYFEKISRELTPQRQLKEEAESVIELLMSSVQYTAELYHELQVLDRIEQDYNRKRFEMDNAISNKKGDNLAILKAELKSQKKQVRNLKKKSLWSRSLEEVMEKLVDVVHFLLLEIHSTFGSVESHVPAEGPASSHQRLGPAGLSLHYANVVMQIDTLVARSSSMPQNTRDALYQCLPPNIKSALRYKLQSFHVKEELTVTEVKDEMEKTLQWLVPMSTNTAKAHHGFGWVGEWANSGTEINRKPAAGPADIIRIETLHHADKEKTEAYILELVLWLNHLASKYKTDTNGGGIKSSTKSPAPTPPQNSNQQQPKNESQAALAITTEEENLLHNVITKKRIPKISMSQDFDSEQPRLKKHDRLSKSCSHSAKKESKDPVPDKRPHSVVSTISFGIDKEKTLDSIDRVDVPR